MDINNKIWEKVKEIALIIFSLMQLNCSWTGVWKIITINTKMRNGMENLIKTVAYTLNPSREILAKKLDNVMLKTENSIYIVDGEGRLLEDMMFFLTISR